MGDLTGRTAIVTGAGRGLGRAHALRFAELGAGVVVNDVGEGKDSPAQSVVEEITASGGRAVAHSGSASSWDSGKAMVDLAVSEFGGLDILINNAGILRDRTLANMSEEEFDAVIDVHLKGHFVPLRHAAEYWKNRSKAGETVNAAVVNTSSASGLFGNPGQTNYASAKAGIAAMTLVAARELERYGVRVNCIAPAARTRLTLQTPGMGERLEAQSKAAGFDLWAPENVTPLVAWLSQADCTVSGQVFKVSGGHIGLQQGWTETEVLDKEGAAWTEDELDEKLTFAPNRPADATTTM
ncbi:SDR family oxidoreductase [Brevibacterium atlanticum]|uniref:SDR family oxidoreductase n=1 Tax=Brevibacterium atlanticum TaxID=2697563 RepID=UPI00142299F5|nr:SDR family oxidoreductase [Brevibacterium atlanticum]